MDHLMASLTLFADVPFSKAGGVESGYAPHHRFAGIDWLASGLHCYVDTVRHYPGETWLAQIRFPSWEYFGETVRAGDRFDILEGERLVGEGVVQFIISYA